MVPYIEDETETGTAGSPAQRSDVVMASGEVGQGFREWAMASLMTVSARVEGLLMNGDGGSRLVMMWRRMRYSFCLKRAYSCFDEVAREITSCEEVDERFTSWKIARVSSGGMERRLVREASGAMVG